MHAQMHCTLGNQWETGITDFLAKSIFHTEKLYARARSTLRDHINFAYIFYNEKACTGEKQLNILIAIVM